jgi:ABC-type sugar transport system ATPase subunit
MPSSTVTADGRTIMSVHEIIKDFPGLRALDGVSMEVHSGEILALLGQNGSGKSTLVKILAGVYSPDSGTVHVHGGSADAAVRDRLHVLHQDLGLIGSLSTVENLALNGHRAGVGLGPLRRRAENARARAVLARFGIDIDIHAPVARLTPAQRTVVAIARAMDGWTDPRSVLVLDEPTAALQGEEVGVLFSAVREAARAGAGVVFISHRLEEVVELAGRVVVLRDGRLVADTAAAGLTSTELGELILGRSVTAGAKPVVERPEHDERPALTVRGLTGGVLRPFDIDVRAGEVVGIAGNLGSGRELVAGLVFGSVRRSGGTVTLVTGPLQRARPSESVRRGMAYVPADRHADGAVMAHDVVENMTLPLLRPLCRGRIHVDRAREWAETRDWSARVGVHPVLPRRPLGLFSGGNQQKVVIARWLRTAPVVLLVEEPTQGVDIGSSESIRSLIVDAARRGAAVLVASSDNADLMRMCSRVIVLRDGVRTAELHGRSLSDRRLTEECLGVNPRELTATAAALGDDRWTTS